jgi:tRNA-dihydrouridine synthase B
MNQLETCDKQVRALSDWFDELADRHDLWPAAANAANQPYIRLSA